MKVLTSMASIGVCSLLCVGCVNIRVGSSKGTTQLRSRGLVSGHASLTPISEFDGSFLKAGVLPGKGRRGEWASIDVWPLGGIGVGFVGARVRILPLEAGVGVLHYDPKPVPEAFPICPKGKEGEEAEAGECTGEDGTPTESSNSPAGD